MAKGFALYQYQNAANYINRYDFEEEGKVSDFSIKNFVSLDSLDSLKNIFGAEGSNIGQNLYNKLKPYDNIIQNPSTAKELDFIPTILSTQVKSKLDKGVKEGVVLSRNENGVPVYLLDIRLNLLHAYSKNDSKFNSFSLLGNTHLLIKIGVIDTFFTGIDMGISTTRDFLNSYLKYYYYHNFEGQVTNYQQDEKKNEFVYDDKNNYFISYQHTKSEPKIIDYYLQVDLQKNKDISSILEVRGLEQHFETTLTTLIKSKNMPEDRIDKVMENDNIFPVASAGLKYPSNLAFTNQEM